MELLERTWRANFAARAAQGGLRGNNNTDLARAMHAWIAFGDEEAREKREKEEDATALDIRRRRLHSLETERLGLTKVCRCDTRVVTEDEEIGPQCFETNERQPADGDGSNPILVDDEPNAEPLHQTAVDPLEDLEPSKPTGHPSAADQIASIVELLRKRQREEREESDIRREEQVLLNKRLAMMGEQVQMLSKLIPQHNPPPASPSLTVNLAMNKSADAPAGPEVEAETAASSGAVHDTIQIVDGSADNALEERSDTSPEAIATTQTIDGDADTHTEDEVAEVGANGRTDKSIEPDAVAGPDHRNIDNNVMNKAVGDPAYVSIWNNVESPAAGVETATTISTTAIEDEAIVMETSRTTQATETV